MAFTITLPIRNSTNNNKAASTTEPASAVLVKSDASDHDSAERTITLRFVNRAANEILVNLHSTTQLKEAMDSYAEHMQIARHRLRFNHDGVSILDGSTPEDLGMKDGDMVEVYAWWW